MYLDTCYIAKFYFNKPESPQVRELVRQASSVHSSLWAFAEFHSVLHRRLREGSIPHADARNLTSQFSKYVEKGLCNLVPVHEALLRRPSTLILAAPSDLFLPTADAVHLATAQAGIALPAKAGELNRCAVIAPQSRSSPAD